MTDTEKEEFTSVYVEAPLDLIVAYSYIVSK
jgi:hypothetical protein